jgi:hypothetical protein
LVVDDRGHGGNLRADVKSTAWARLDGDMDVPWRGRPTQALTVYHFASPVARAALEAVGTGTLDPMLNLRFMTLGPWFLAAGWVALRTRNPPKALAYLGTIAGCGALLAAATSFLDLQGLPLGLAVGAVAVVIHPIWLIGVGLALGRASERTSLG